MSANNNGQQDSIIVTLENTGPNDWHKDALLKTLDYLQAIITRMADNSRSCKTWTAGLVTALAAITFKSNQPALLLVAFSPESFYGGWMDSI
jgi:hypothetical protein